MSYPKAVKKPAHSNATYDAPITNVLPGALLNENISSLVIPNSLSPGISAYDGLPPTAITILSAVTVSIFPFPYLI